MAIIPRVGRPNPWVHGSNPSRARAQVDTQGSARVEPYLQVFVDHKSDMRTHERTRSCKYLSPQILVSHEYYLRVTIILTTLSTPLLSNGVWTECFTSIEYTRGKRIFAGTNIHFKILVANASIDFSPCRILEYSLEAIRPIYTQSGPYVELRTSNLSSHGCILSYIIEYYALRWCILLLYVASMVYLRPTEMVEAQILADTREYRVFILVQVRILEYLWDIRECYVINTRSNASTYLWSNLGLDANGEEGRHGTQDESSKGCKVVWDG
jgi:hypothetical protein